MDTIFSKINELGEFPEYVVWSPEDGLQPNGGAGERYEYMDSGGSGKIYRSVAGGDTVIKLMRVRKEKFESEVDMQSQAAGHGLAPVVLASGSSNEVDGLNLCFMLMPLLKEHIDLYDFDTMRAYQHKVCQYIDTLTSQLLMANTVDPRRHFYEVGGKLQMIDFGEFQRISTSEVAEKREAMAEACGVACAFRSKRRKGRGKSRTKSKSRIRNNRSVRLRSSSRKKGIVKREREGKRREKR
tara:strand:+ start:4752 stop:5474 length:723 start_codon:yes stop_codon:yes gene_type:complete